MNLLALDTSSAACSVCLQIEHQEYSSHFIEPKSHTRTLLPTIKRLLENAGAVINDLDAIILGVGPGSFVGTRVAAADIGPLKLIRHKKRPCLFGTKKDMASRTQ